MPVIGVEPRSAAAAAAGWDAEGDDLTASARALAAAVPLTGGFTERVEPVAAQFAHAWASIALRLGGRCRGQAESVRLTVAGLMRADGEIAAGFDAASRGAA